MFFNQKQKTINALDTFIKQERERLQKLIQEEKISKVFSESVIEKLHQRFIKNFLETGTRTTKKDHIEYLFLWYMEGVRNGMEISTTKKRSHK